MELETSCILSGVAASYTSLAGAVCMVEDAMNPGPTDLLDTKVALDGPNESIESKVTGCKCGEAMSIYIGC